MGRDDAVPGGTPTARVDDGGPAAGGAVMPQPRQDPTSSDFQALTEYWDDVVRRAPTTPIPPTSVPPALTSLIRHLHAAEEADQHRPRYEDRLLRDLLASYQESTTMSSAPFTPASASSPPRWHGDRVIRRPGPGADRARPIT